MVETNSEGKEGKVTRRQFARGFLLAAVAGAFGSLLSLLKVLSPPASKGGGYVATVALGDLLVYAKGSRQGSLLKASDFQVGDAVLAYPQGKTGNEANLVQLIRMKEKEFKPPTRLELTDQGFVAYSAICTHLGCTVSWMKNEKDPGASYTECFCHNSIFNPARGARVIGGPAPIPLAQIGVKVSKDGTLVFTSGFSGPVGPQV
ncbi:MAG: ubiquinol-cytochrome c reductase iron-sulfur subunit [Syntrophobacteraceae bacterium]|nr:ubiquinol-cytochrome c reductase iron-sulfur subunit [Syntrophobacteraceae bacterium]